MRIVIIVVMLASLTAITAAQNQTLKFEVASVKPAAATSAGDEFMSTLLYLPGGRLRMTNSPLRSFIRTAYQVEDFEVVGGSGWMNSDRYDLEAKAPGEADRDQLRMMLQAVLADRFKLQLHREMRNGTDYALVVGPNGPKIKLSTEPGGFRGGAGRITGKRSMPQLARFLSGIIHSPVTDETGLEGTFDLTLVWAADELAIVGDSLSSTPSIFTAVQDQLGLKLEAHKGSLVEVLVIDHAEKPDAN
jgi:uncharacterized protein (TIGR03435 family)